jgi:hypothetical protein
LEEQRNVAEWEEATTTATGGSPSGKLLDDLKKTGKRFGSQTARITFLGGVTLSEHAVQVQEVTEDGTENFLPCGQWFTNFEYMLVQDLTENAPLGLEARIGCEVEDRRFNVYLAVRWVCLQKMSWGRTKTGPGGSGGLRFCEEA